MVTRSSLNRKEMIIKEEFELQKGKKNIRIFKYNRLSLP